MASLTNYRGLDVIDGSPVGAGGAAIQDNFVSLVDWGPKSVWAQTADPTVNDDAGDEFYPGSLWLRTNVTPAKLFVCKTSAPGAAVWTQIGGVPDVLISSKSTNYTAVAADKGNLILCTSAITLSFTAAATLGAGWWCYYQNTLSDNTTYVTLDPNDSELIDGLLLLRSYSGEVRKIICDGTGFRTLLIRGGEVLFTADADFIVPTGASMFRVTVVGGGGGGGAGQGGSAGTVRGAGSGGGGGARAQADFTPTELGGVGTTIPLVVAPQTNAVTSGAGAAGGKSRFGTDVNLFGGLLESFGGGGGAAGNGANDLRGGGGGGTGTVGSVGGGAAMVGAVPGLFASVAAGGGGAGVPNAGWLAYNAEYGGASGGGCPAGGEGAPGGISQYGGAGGGGGGGVSAANVQFAGSGGGRTASNLIGWGGGAGAGAAGGFPGGNGPVRNTGRSGTGGGGGGGNASGNGGAGGNGAAPGGGGGGGGAGTGASTTAGAGGKGARGEVRVRYWP